MATNKLTDLAVRSAKPSASDFKLTDGEGLYLLVRPNGSRLWQMAYRFAGKQKTLSFGPFPHVTLAAARTARHRARHLIANGKDPGAKPTDVEMRREPLPSESLRELSVRWFDARKSAWTPAHASRVWNRVDHDLLKELGARAVSDITRGDLLSALRLIESRNAVETARRVRGYAEDIFRFAAGEGQIAANPAVELVHAMAKSPPKKHRAALRERDLPAFIAKLNAYQGEPLTRYALGLIMLTFVRSAELRFAQWSEFEGLDTDKPLWRIPAERMKMRSEHLVPLSRLALSAIKSIQALRMKSKFLFPAATRSGVMSENTMIYALYRMGYHSRATVHGFRGTASTILNEHNFNRDWIERQLAHAERDGVRAAYNSAEWMQERRAMMDWWSGYLEARGLNLAA